MKTISSHMWHFKSFRDTRFNLQNTTTFRFSTLQVAPVQYGDRLLLDNQFGNVAGKRMIFMWQRGPVTNNEAKK